MRGFFFVFVVSLLVVISVSFFTCLCILLLNSATSGMQIVFCMNEGDSVMIK